MAAQVEFVVKLWLEPRPSLPPLSSRSLAASLIVLHISDNPLPLSGPCCCAHDWPSRSFQICGDTCAGLLSLLFFEFTMLAATSS